VYDGMRLAVIDMSLVSGNICVFCYNGRSRSAAFVAAYLVATCGYSPEGAYAHQSAALQVARPTMCDSRGVDRDRRFIKYVESMFSREESII
jgi:hypothetical protein